MGRATHSCWRKRTGASLFGLVAMLSLVVYGCGSGAGTGSEETSVVVAESMPEATVGTSPDADGESSTERPPEEREFVADSEAEGGDGSAADSLISVRHDRQDGYERVVLDLGVGKTSADNVPEWTLNTPENDGLLRMHVPSVSATSVSEGKLGGEMLRGFHVVRDPEGGVFVDIASREAFSYRVFELEDPARLMVDFASAGMRPLEPLPRKSGKTVVDTPRIGEEVSDPITVSGYSRNFEGRNEISLLDRSGKVISETSTQSNDWSATWGFFETTLEIPEYTGRATLRVGADSPRDGDFEGVEIPIKVVP